MANIQADALTDFLGEIRTGAETWRTMLAGDNASAEVLEACHTAISRSQDASDALGDAIAAMNRVMELVAEQSGSIH